ncbi:TonB-dependent receptor plug domain-containing protein [Hymenobacter sp. RP-2-7]|uniref:TonB-dependent receptor plug domain-containing protein n=1 Tax=Hymenobacter polaris TaxID=2682546 RepID=A0A7Y0FNJ5_9BACT|nr:TonB-dependent receptor plug domain-containing protein [Hymenobacter polaris]NML66973.1 TonB-dependent receptor plug domain-containing protein [Hymenobacter polaris]
MTNRYAFSICLRRLLPIAGALLALGRPAAAQRTEPLPPRPVPLRTVLPDSLAQLVKEPVLNSLVCKTVGVYIQPVPAQNIFFPLTTIQPALSRIAGVQVTPNSGAPGDWATVRMRGSGLRGNDQPLYVIDGLPALNADYAPAQLPALGYGLGTGPQARATMPNPLLFVAPADVASVEILKGAATTTRFGSQGANGMVLITTRKGGRAGEAQAPRLRYEATAAVQQVRRPVALLDARQYAELANEVWRNDGSRGAVPFAPATLAALGAGTDWQAEVLQPALLQSHFVSLDGSTARTRYLASANYLGQGGVVLNSSLRRYGLRLQAEHRFSDKLSAQLSVSGASLTRTLPNERTVPAALLSPPTVPATTGGAPTVTNGPLVTDPGYANTFYNPLTLARDAASTDRTRRLLLQASLRYQLRPAWRLEAALSGEQAHTDATRRELAQPTQPPYTPSAYEALGLAQEATTTNARLGTSYQPALGSRHELELSGSLLYQRLSRAASFGQAAPGQTNSRGGQSGSLAVSSALAEGRYTLAQQLRLTGLLRAEYALGADYLVGPSDKLQLYPGAEAAWTLEGDHLPGDGRTLSRLKLEAALGQSSNASLFTGLFGPVPVILTPGLNPGPVPLPRTTALNASVQVELFDNGLSVQPTYYRHRTAHASVGQLFAQPLSPDGSPVFYLRDVDLLNQGVELTASYTYAREKRYFNVSFSAAHNQQTVQNVAGSTPGPGLAVGEAAHPYFGYQRQGLDASGQLQYRDQNGDGQLDALDGSYFGRGLPSWLLNLSQELTLGRFTLQTQWDALLGYQLLSPVLTILDQPTATTNASARVLVRWTGPGTSTDVPRASRYRQFYGYDNLSPESASHLRLTQLTLGYRLPLPEPHQVRVWVGGQNLLVLSNYRGYDPNVSSAGGLGQLAGYDASTYPVARVWQLGVQATW